MIKTKTTLALAALTAALGAGAIGVGSSLAAENQAPVLFPGLVSAIAERFNLDPNEVQAVVDEHRDELKERHEVHFAENLDERLAEGVTNGDLTAEQAEAIKAKLEEMKNTPPPDLANSTPEEMKAEMTARHEELKAWAEANNIPEDYFPMAHGFVVKAFGGPGRGPHGHMFQVRVEDNLE